MKQIIIPQELVDKYTRKVKGWKGLQEIQPILTKTKTGDVYTLPPEVLELKGMDETLKEMVDKKIITSNQALDKLPFQDIEITQEIIKK